MGDFRCAKPALSPSGPGQSALSRRLRRFDNLSQKARFSAGFVLGE
jgi:hypothetical protein